jgi:two-component system phosphate regulon sensor histidine kinase PhoR
MPLLQPPLEPAPDEPTTGGQAPGHQTPGVFAVSSRGAPTVLVGAVAAAALGVLVALGKTDAEAGLLTAAGLVAIGLVVGLRSPASAAAASPSRSAAASPASPEPGDVQTYVSALELAPNPILVVSAEEADDLAGRRIAFANASARDLLRVAREGALLVAALRNPNVLEAIDESLFGGLDRVVTYEPGGPQNRFWRVWTNPLPGTPARPRLALVIMQDETDIRLNERLRADFLANASHELRTPLASLTGFIETLRGHAKDDEAARERFLAIMGRQAERMARLIEDLMSLSRIELNEHVRPSGVCDLSVAIADVADALSPQLEAKGVTFDFALPARGEAWVAADRDQLIQVIQNLLDNAVKYSPIGGVVKVEGDVDLTLDAAAAFRPDARRLSAPEGGRMSLQTPTWSPDVRYAILRVSDLGPGLAREVLPRLSERFYRVEGQKSGDRSGTGLGLAIVKHIVNRHRGGFLVESAPGQGAVFCVYFPMAQQTLAAPNGARYERNMASTEASTREEIKLS